MGERGDVEGLDDVIEEIGQECESGRVEESWDGECVRHFDSEISIDICCNNRKTCS